MKASYPTPGEEVELADPLWEQQPLETKKHYAMFLGYASLRPSERSLAQAWRLHVEGSSKEGLPMSTFYRNLAHGWHWQERAAARDLFLAQDQMARWVERDKERRDTAYTLGDMLTKQALRALNRIDKLDESEFKVSLADAKDVALAGTQLQERAIPTIQLGVDQMKLIVARLPPEKRQRLLDRLMAGQQQQGLLPATTTTDPDSEVIDAEYSNADEETD